MARGVLIALGIGGGLLVGIAVLAVLLTRREPPLYPPTTPEGVTQRYLQALAQEQWAEAYTYLAPDLQARCTLDAWQSQVAFARYTLEQSAVLLRGVDYRDEGTVVVRVVFSQPAPPRPFQLTPQDWTSEHQFRLKRQADGSWKFAVFPWPLWPEGQCP
ncbi:MAG: hypothetical protein NZ951_05635 [Dehalococcoidia bacterium]|nr:hypothetical protein [Dehalococcoidia bacterium]MDW8120387.1 hypothetical protein [Chloroflexota bacterium]